MWLGVLHTLYKLICYEGDSRFLQIHVGKILFLILQDFFLLIGELHQICTGGKNSSAFAGVAYFLLKDFLSNLQSGLSDNIFIP